MLPTTTLQTSEMCQSFPLQHWLLGLEQALCTPPLQGGHSQRGDNQQYQSQPGNQSSQSPAACQGCVSTPILHFASLSAGKAATSIGSSFSQEKQALPYVPGLVCHYHDALL